MSLENKLRESFDKLFKALSSIPSSDFYIQKFNMSGVLVSAADIVSYQIGWGSLLISWYKQGVAEMEFIMPGDGFTKWEYKKIALHFYEKYSSFPKDDSLERFNNIFLQILEIAKNEQANGQLDQLGAWSWCKLKNQKEWPLSKWITVNTVAPWQRATILLRN